MNDFGNKIYDENIYSKNNIFRAINAYRSIADITVEYIPGGWNCTFKSLGYPIDKIINEFGNYLLELAQHEVMQ